MFLFKPELSMEAKPAKPENLSTRIIGEFAGKAGGHIAVALAKATFAAVLAGLVPVGPYHLAVFDPQDLFYIISKFETPMQLITSVND